MDTYDPRLYCTLNGYRNYKCRSEDQRNQPDSYLSANDWPSLSVHALRTMFQEC